MTIGHRHNRIARILGRTAFESLESRSMMSADVAGAAGEMTNAASAVQVADDAFLNPHADAPTDTPAITASPESMNDADMYDFGGLWGAPESTVRTGGAVDEVFGDLDAMDGRTEWTRTPADVLATRNGTREESDALRDASEDHDLPADYSGDSGADDAELAANMSLLMTAAPVGLTTTGPRITWIGDDTSNITNDVIPDIDLGDAALVASYV